MKICLCGSTRFMDQFHEANVQLSLAGHIVYSVATSTKGDFIPTDDQKMILDLVHLQKIAESESVCVVGRQPDGSYYIGESTRREIAYARMKNIPVHFYEPGREIFGPRNEWLESLEEAATTDEKRKQAEARRQAEMAAIFGTDDGSEEQQPAEQPN